MVLEFLAPLFYSLDVQSRRFDVWDGCEDISIEISCCVLAPLYFTPNYRFYV